jgi:hypothetical protein
VDVRQIRATVHDALPLECLHFWEEAKGITRLQQGNHLIDASSLLFRKQSGDHPNHAPGARRGKGPDGSCVNVGALACYPVRRLLDRTQRSGPSVHPKTVELANKIAEKRVSRVAV